MSFNLDNINEATLQENVENQIREAALSWNLRSVALKQPNFYAEDIADIEGKLESQVDMLSMTPDIAWAACQNILNLESVSSELIFVCSILAFKSLEAPKIQYVVDLTVQDGRAYEGLISAMAWLPEKVTHSWADKFLKSKDLNHKYIGVSYFSASRNNPGEVLRTLLERVDCREHSALYERCLRLVGEINRLDLNDCLYHALDHGSEQQKFWAAWSLVLLGEKNYVKCLLPYLKWGGTYLDYAVQTIFRVVSIDVGLQLISELAKSPHQLRTAIRAAGVLGDPHLVPWLIGRISMPPFSRVAGESITLITGIDFEKNDLQLSLPEITEITTRGNTDFTHFELHEDEYLPWPDVEKIKALWEIYRKKFKTGKRYFLGKRVKFEYLIDDVQQGSQRQRYAAALELSLMDTKFALINIDRRQNLH